MLKALELIGFKSFADKTRFEFPPGITVVVGPNGSGKSNIVDAIKWVLGEQSAKSLRGKDMADVIFKGAIGRKVMNTAEATIIFDNQEGLLPVDAPEVHVTRRVYRSGEGEYLINRQPCRLKDIRDMFRGTGVGADAYSLIEQGKVDQMLQASPRDRRAIFEEAAGISRFKAKKIQTQRRLERVEQNLLRLSDIVDEVEGRLRSIRAQASKARRYREYSQRLQQLRTFVGWTDWKRLSEQIEALATEADGRRQQAEQATAQVEADERQLAQLETEAAERIDQLRQQQARESHSREQINTLEARCALQRQRAAEMEQEAAACRHRLGVLTSRAVDADKQLATTLQLLQDAETEFVAVGQQLQLLQQQAAATADELQQQRQQYDQRSAALVASQQQLASLGMQITSCQAQLDVATQQAEQARQRSHQLRQWIEEADQQLQATRDSEQSATGQFEQLNAARKESADELEENRRNSARRKEDLAELQGRCHGLRERAAVLEDLQRTLEGFSDGTREILHAARRGEGGVYADVVGVLADLIDAPRELAPLVDAALGVAAQHLVLRGDQLLRQVASGQLRPDGRVGLIRSPAAMPQLPDLWGDDPQVIGRADRLVATPEEHQAVVTLMLGRTYLVRDLEAAIRLSRAAPPGTRLVTRRCELVEPEGAVVIGSQHAAGGLVSRRSELRSLRQEIQASELQLGEARREVARLDQNIAAQTETLQLQDDELGACREQLADLRVQRRTLQDRGDKMRVEQQEQDTVLQTAAAQAAQWQQELDDARDQLQDTTEVVERMEQENQSQQLQIQQLDLQQSAVQQQAGQARIQAATSEQQLETLRAQRTRFQDDQNERAREVDDCRNHLQQTVQRRTEAERTILAATAAAAEQYLQKEHAAAAVVQAGQLQQQAALRRQELLASQQQAAKKIRQLQEKLHRMELELGELRHQRDTQALRLKEDYEIDVSQIEQSLPAEESERDEIEAEIHSLRKRLNSIGAVNMEALNELDQLESRFNDLHGQFQDLTKAKDALERIIHRINADSRRLFVETLEAIRTNFQALYRRAFGGGKADLVLEEGEDVLECGIDILATPPGKPSFNNSLLSGGEKALTAVALLLAIFQFRPSPFCVLDEVDAPFDEANIGRFVDVLHEFLGWTRFVVVTHSKKTMTAANTLYGVTMQESGVSKRVSVRFEDVSEDGEISEDALRRDDDEAA